MQEQIKSEGPTMEFSALWDSLLSFAALPASLNSHENIKPQVRSILRKEDAPSTDDAALNDTNAKEMAGSRLQATQAYYPTKGPDAFVRCAFDEIMKESSLDQLTEKCQQRRLDRLRDQHEAQFEETARECGQVKYVYSKSNDTGLQKIHKSYHFSPGAQNHPLGCRCFVCQQRIADATSEAVEKDAIILAMQRCERKITRLQQRISPGESKDSHPWEQLRGNVRELKKLKQRLAELQGSLPESCRVFAMQQKRTR